MTKDLVDGKESKVQRREEGKETWNAGQLEGGVSAFAVL
jgi:hypothetical protein